eukprot:6734700-Alexandrium_andersonii.AAC.1
MHKRRRLRIAWQTGRRIEYHIAHAHGTTSLAKGRRCAVSTRTRASRAQVVQHKHLYTPTRGTGWHGGKPDTQSQAA